VYVPAKVVVNEPLPVVIVFHGSGGDGEKFYSISGWKEKADAEKLIAVFPNSWKYCIIEDGVRKENAEKWNDDKTTLCANTQETLADDVKFIREMTSFLEKNYPVNKNKIYATGFSNGGSFTAKLAMETGDIFTAIAVSAGRLQDTSLQMITLIPVIHTIGMGKQQFGGTAPAFQEDFIHDPYSETIIPMMLPKMNLQNTYIFKQDSTSLTYTFPFLTNGALSNSPFIFVGIRGLNHEYANGRNSPVSYADLFWDFFNTYSK
jgi:polyhydroxybutyrate depolymerase